MCDTATQSGFEPRVKTSYLIQGGISLNENSANYQENEIKLFPEWLWIVKCILFAA